MSNYEPQVNDSVMVDEPEKNDAWTHRFFGIITDIIEDAEPKIYIVEDNDSDMWKVERDKFEVEEDLV